MLTELFIYTAVINFSTAFEDSDKHLRNKRSAEYVPCDWGWYYFHDKCYRIGGRKPSERLRWDGALKRCRRYGADLVSIHSKEEQAFVSYLQLDVKSHLWIGLNDRDNQSDYRWSDGSAFNCTNWDRKSPSKIDHLGTKEDCIQTLFHPVIDVIGKWNDRDCNATEAYVCEMNANPRKRTPNEMYCSSEEGGGWKFQSSCYHVVTEIKPWEKAEKYCKDNYDGHLVTILDLVEDSFLEYILADIKKDLWIGIKIQNQLQQKWSSGWYVSYDGFKNGKVNFTGGTCAARKKRKEWIAIPCTTQLPFICEVSKVSPPVLKSPGKGFHCPTEFHGWRDLGGEYCYYFEKERRLGYYAALFDCKRRGGNLVSLHSKEESDMLLPFVKYLGEFFFIGLFRLMGREDEFAWTDGSAVDYEDWKPGEPNSEDEKCVEAVTSDDPFGNLFSWNDVCCEEKRGFICSVKKTIPRFYAPVRMKDNMLYADSENSISGTEDDCTNYCIAQSSYLHEMVIQSPDAKRVP